MNRFIQKSLLSLLFLGIVTQLSAKELMYYIDMCSFYTTEGKPYTEVYLDIDAASVQYAPVKNGFQGSLEIRLVVTKKGAPVEEAPVFEKTFELLSPVLSDTSAASTKFGIMDVRRIGLDPGLYELTGYLKDNVMPSAPQHKFVMDILLQAQKSDFATISDIEFVQSVKQSTQALPHSKLGLDVLPLVTNNTFQDMDSLHFYLETYNTDKESEGVYFVNAFISLANSASKLKNYQRTLRQTSKPLDVAYTGFDITGLPTQTYFLNIELYSKDQKIIASSLKKFFVVNTSMTMETGISASAFDELYKLDEEQLNYYIHTLYYISTNTERDFADALTTLDEKKNYFYGFWENRKGNAADAIRAWTEYKVRVDYANQHFKAAHLEGWRTDRGRIMLQYGSPNDIERNPSSNDKHPYDVWRFNKLKTQSNVRFIFFNPNEATAEYVLIHSDMRGEINNPRYEFQLTRTANDANLDNNSMNGSESWR